jgi:hypothetical protein
MGVVLPAHFNDESIMMFAVPQCLYYDSTYINKKKVKRLVLDYTLTAKGFTKDGVMDFSKRWNLVMPAIIMQNNS